MRKCNGKSKASFLLCFCVQNFDQATGEFQCSFPLRDISRTSAFDEASHGATKPYCLHQQKMDISRWASLRTHEHEPPATKEGQGIARRDDITDRRPLAVQQSQIHAARVGLHMARLQPRDDLPRRLRIVALNQMQR